MNLANYLTQKKSQKTKWFSAIGLYKTTRQRRLLISWWSKQETGVIPYNLFWISGICFCNDTSFQTLGLTGLVRVLVCHRLLFDSGLESSAVFRCLQNEQMFYTFYKSLEFWKENWGTNLQFQCYFISDRYLRIFKTARKWTKICPSASVTSI